MRHFLSKSLRTLADIFAYFFIFILIIIGFTFHFLSQEGPLQNESVVLIEQGDGLSEIGQKLVRQQIISSSFLFSAFTLLKGNAKKLRYGEYGFKPHMNLDEIIDHLAFGPTIRHKFLVKEGDTVSDIRTRLAQLTNLKGDLPYHTPEGVLMPETYYYEYGDKRASLLNRMNKSMQETLGNLWHKRAQDLPFSTPLEALILVSIVEKETRLPEERPRVAAVFINRLKLGIPLQADPTVNYAITKGETILDRPLSRKDLSFPSPYNTYMSKGLPPGPICNPGKDTLAAVLNPQSTKELYFVVNGKGGHEFAESLEKHNKNVSNWRKNK